MARWHGSSEGTRLGCLGLDISQNLDWRRDLLILYPSLMSFQNEVQFVAIADHDLVSFRVQVIERDVVAIQR